jgi:shikimate dehydrogenase
MDDLKPQLNPIDYPGKDVYGVIGNPIAHSKSPVIHQFFAEQTKQPIHYGRIFAELKEFKVKAQEFFAQGGKGLNITVPFKLEAYEMAQKKTARAEIAKAANVLWIKDGELWCDNTDGIGFVRDLECLLKQQNIKPQEARVLILGAGGAAQGVIDPLMSLGIKSISIANRTFSKAQDLAQQFSGLHAIALDDLSGATNESENAENAEKFDLILNATATGLGDSSPIAKELLQKLAGPKTIAYDMVYGKETQFMKDAAGLGLLAVDGLGMLVQQAADAFVTWRNPNVALDIDGALQATRASYLSA